MSHQQRLSRLGRRNQHPLPLPTTGSAVQLQPCHSRPDQHPRLSRKCLWFVGRWLARRPLLGPVQQATPRSLPAGIETTPALDSYDSGPSGMFGFRLWRRGGTALDFFVSDSTGLRTILRIRMLTSERRFFGYGMVAVGLTFVPVATMTYVSDCYLPVNADALLLVNGLKVCCSHVFRSGHLLISVFPTEHRGFRIPTRSRWMGAPQRLHQCLRHPSWSLCRSHGPGNSAGSVWREDPSQDRAVEDYHVSGKRAAKIYIVLIS
jgi:hypothetical protein